MCCFVLIFPESDTEPYPEGKLSITNRTGNLCDMEISLCICASEIVFGVFGFICSSFFLWHASLLNTKISVLNTFVTNSNSVILQLQSFRISFSPLPQLFCYNEQNFCVAPCKQVVKRLQIYTSNIFSILHVFIDPYFNIYNITVLYSETSSYQSKRSCASVT